jgi:hypothetical protein
LRLLEHPTPGILDGFFLGLLLFPLGRLDFGTFGLFLASVESL